MGWQKRLWWKWAPWRSGTVFFTPPWDSLKTNFQPSYYCCLAFLHLSPPAKWHIAWFDIVWHNWGVFLGLMVKNENQKVTWGQSLNYLWESCANKKSPPWQPTAEKSTNGLGIKSKFIPATFFAVRFYGWNYHLKEALKDFSDSWQLIGNEFNGALRISALDLIKDGRYWNQCIKCSVDMQSSSSSLFSSSWRQDLCNRWNPLTVMRAWQLWHFDDADIHIPEHKGKEMKKPLTPLSVPAPPPPQLTIYHRPCLLQLPKHTTPKPTNKQIKSRINMASVPKKHMNKWRQKQKTNCALNEHKSQNTCSLQSSKNDLRLSSCFESWHTTTKKPPKTGQPNVFLVLNKPAKQHQLCWCTSRDQWHTRQFTHLNQPRCFSSCPCEAFLSDLPAWKTRG